MLVTVDDKEIIWMKVSNKNIYLISLLESKDKTSLHYVCYGWFQCKRHKLVKSKIFWQIYWSHNDMVGFLIAVKDKQQWQFLQADC